MRVILLQDVGGVGKRHEVKEVADGHALNFLIPRGLAEQATREKLAAHEKRVAESVAQKEKEQQELNGIIQGLRGERIELKVRATEKGGLFKTIGPKEIAQALNEQKHAVIPEQAIHPLEPVKTTGDHIIKISAQGTESEVMLKIVAA